MSNNYKKKALQRARVRLKAARQSMTTRNKEQGSIQNTNPKEESGSYNSHI